jgi:hypothetical protein
MPNIVTSDSASLDIEVVSSANPDSSLLRAIRHLVPTNESIRQVFIEAQEESDAGGSRQVDRQRLLVVLSDAYPHEGLDQVAEYLADEFEQIGEGILLISPDTGKAVARVTSDSLYQASPVPRESGNMIERGLMIRPEVESFLAYWSFEREHEAGNHSQVIARLNQTDLQREEGDPRTLVLSRNGRRAIAQMVQDSIGSAFVNPNGPAKYLLEYFPLGGDSFPLSSSCTPIKVVPWSRVRRRIQDQLSVNTKYDAFTSTLASVASSWSRSVLSTLLEKAASRPLQLEPEDLDDLLDGRSGGVWVCEPNLARALMGHGCRVFPVNGPPNVAVQLTRESGYLEFDDSKVGTNHREFHDRWTVESAAEVTLHVYWDFINTFHVLGDFTSGSSVEVV